MTSTRHRGWALAALAGLALLAGCIGDANASPLSGRPPSAVLSAALATLRAGGTAHIDISTTTPQGSLTCSGDATASGGWQVIKSGTGQRVVIILISGVGYVAGNISGLESFLNVPGGQARSHAGQWIAVRPGQQVGEHGYRGIISGITLPAVASEVTPTGPLTLTAPTVVAGQPAIGVQGRAPAGQHFPPAARATLYVAINGARPLLYELSGASGYTDQVTFSNWGGSVQLAAPPHAIPARALQQASLALLFIPNDSGPPPHPAPQVPGNYRHKPLRCDVMRNHFSRPLVAVASLLAGACLLAGCTGSSPSGTASSGAHSSGAHSGGAHSSGAGASSPAAGSGSSSAGSAPATTAPPAPGSAAALLAGAIAALKSGGSVHIDITDQSPQLTVTYSDEATASGGRQVITTSNGGRVTILYISGTAYVTGNGPGLVFLNVPADQAARVVDRWVSVRPGQSLGQSTFSDIADGITLSSVATELQVGSPLTLTAPTIAEGQRVVGVQGSAPGSLQLPGSTRVTFDVTAGGTPRPVLYTASGTGGYQNRMVFSHWGETVSLTAPPGAIPATSTETPILA